MTKSSSSSSRSQSATGLNITTAVGDQIEAIYLGGGTWRILNYVTVGGAVPTGVVVATAGSTADPGYLLCYGEAVSRTTYAALFARLGTTYGSGDGSTTFNLPDYRGRVLGGIDNMGGTAAGRLTLFNADSVGNSGGAQQNVVQQANLAPFSMSITSWSGFFPQTGASYFFRSNQGNGGANPSVQPGSPNTDDGSILVPQTAITFQGGSVASGGQNTPFPTVQPTIVVNYQIKY
jgi:microcystin-dependent protein